MKLLPARFVSFIVLAGLSVFVLARCAEEKNPILEPYAVQSAPTGVSATTSGSPSGATGGTGGGNISDATAVDQTGGSFEGGGSSCDLLKQDCATTSSQFGCYPQSSSGRCYAAGGHTTGSTCKFSAECRPGLVCVVQSGDSQGKCEKLCDFTASTDTTCAAKTCKHMNGLPEAIGACQ